MRGRPLARRPCRLLSQQQGKLRGMRRRAGVATPLFMVPLLLLHTGFQSLLNANHAHLLRAHSKWGAGHTTHWPSGG